MANSTSVSLSRQISRRQEQSTASMYWDYWDFANKENDYLDYWNDTYMYTIYKFEIAVYLYAWEILVIVCFLQNLLVILVFLKREMRNPTNTVLSAIAVSDSLTGLVTLPTYIMVYQSIDPFVPYNYEYDFVYNTTLQPTQKPDYDEYDKPTYGYEYDYDQPTYGYEYDYDQPTYGYEYDYYEYELSGSLCRGFMISKYFLSRSFHTISLFLTLFLEIQKYVSMAYPFKYKTCFNRFKVVNIYCILTFLFCPLLHVYHLVKEKAERDKCTSGCGQDCTYLWVAFLLRHFIPCVTLLTFTFLFIYKLKRGEEDFKRLVSNISQYSRRVSENRRICFIVISVVIVRLIPEIPYSLFLLYNSFDETVNMGRDIDLRRNRIIHMTYELCIIITFISNFYIYIIINKPFRKQLCRAIRLPFRNIQTFLMKKKSDMPGEKIELEMF